MTTPEQPEQIDREAYLKWSALPKRDADAVMAGEWDNTSGMQILAAHRRLGIEQGKRMAGGEVEAIKRELAERTRYAMGILADLREVVDLDDENSESILNYSDDLETILHNIAAVASHLPAALTEQREENP